MILAADFGGTTIKLGIVREGVILVRRRLDAYALTEKATHHTDGGVHVLNLVAGEEAVVESPVNGFEPFIVHYAETFIVPAAVGLYTVRPHGSRWAASASP